MSGSSIVHVAVGVLVNDAREVLVAKRHAHSHQGGLWEFPGGKLEVGESVLQGLHREFLEEVGIHIHDAYPISKIRHDYADKSVLLDVWRIEGHDGEPQGLEGQPVEWRPVSKLKAEDFPRANAHIIDLLRLPAQMAITPVAADWSNLEPLLAGYLRQGVGLIQLRQKQLSGEEYLAWYQRALKFCAGHDVLVLFNHDTASLPETGVPGLHVSARRLDELNARPVAPGSLFSVSCHNEAELQRAEQLGADFVTLSPVQPTAKYSPEAVLGWPRFRQLRRTISVPVYALGGMDQGAQKIARQNGADGIAGISLFINT